MKKEDIQNLLHREIPITKDLGIEVVEVSPDSVKLWAPLEVNSNHKQTAFGGSLYCIAVLSGWVLVQVRLRGMAVTAHTVIQSSKVDYRLPVSQDILAGCNSPGASAWDKLMRQFTRKGRARIGLDCEIRQNGELAVLFQGQYVIHS